MKRPAFFGLLLLSLVVRLSGIAPPAVFADEAEPGKTYRSTIRPLLKTYCHECHAGEVTEAEIDLGAMESFAEVRKHLKTWIKVRHMLDSGQMPPKEAAQPTDQERTKLRTWVREFLTVEAKALAGDPGPVLLRRLSNAEYNHTLRDLTGIDSLDPTREFPVDGAAGEGFTNTGSGQGMSPALLQKYLDAGKEVATHAVLLPDGLRFSAKTTRRDQTDELLAKIQAFYRQFTEDGEGLPVNLQGIQFNTNQGGLLPVKSYLAATLAERDALLAGQKTIAQVASERSLNAKYLQTLWDSLANDKNDNSFLLDSFRSRWRKAGMNDAPELIREIGEAQKALWKFNTVGHIGRQGSPTSWMEAVSPVVHEKELWVTFNKPMDEDTITLSLSASDLGDGRDQDFVVWQEPRIVFGPDETGAERPPILLRDLRPLAGKIEATLAKETLRTEQYLNAVLEIRDSKPPVEAVAKARKLNTDLLAAWTKLLDLDRKTKREIQGHFTQKVEKAQGYEAINGWGLPQTPSMLTNRSKEPITFLTLTVPARGVVVHPSPVLDSIVAWKSPLKGTVQLEGLIADADNKCGNGTAWRVELLTESGRMVLADGTIDNGGQTQVRPQENIAVQPGDLVLIVVSARDKNHSCDTTHIDLKLTETQGEKRVWDLAHDVVDHILAGNPLPDSFGNQDTWHFAAQPGETAEQPKIPPGSTLANWRESILKKAPAKDIEKLSAAVQAVLTESNLKSLSKADRNLRGLLLAWNGPLKWTAAAKDASVVKPSRFGFDPSLFGKHPNGAKVSATDLCLQAPHVLELRLPTSLVAGGEFIVTPTLHEETDKEGSVQVLLTTEKPQSNLLSLTAPILVQKEGTARERVEAALEDFRNLFPPALCYAKIVPVDEVVTLTLFYREDHHLKRLMLNEEQIADLDRLWEELFYVSQEPLKAVVALEQISEFATQDRPDLVKAFVPLREPVKKRAEAFRQQQIEAQPKQVESILRFADQAWRRPLTEAERESLKQFYQDLRQSDIAHEEAIQLLFARVLTAPAFLYKLEQPGPGKKAEPVTDLELATRLSYFLWSSLPDEELRRVAEAGQLQNEKTLLAETRRMLNDARARRLAVEFACQWLHVREFDQNDDKNESLYPEFAAMRGEMYEETVRFFEDMFRNDGSVLELLNADHTFLNAALAKHYGIEGVEGNDWRRVEGIQAKGRGGILGMATILASQSGASRTSPILRGNWVYETLLGERLPRPPANVPVLPDAVPEGLTARQLIERHSSAPACAKCHMKIDPYGFALEQFDAIGRTRSEKADTKTTLPNGKPIEGLEGLRDYLATERREDVVRQFCRKLLGFALGRELQLSDEPLLNEMQTKLKADDFRFHTAVETIVTSPQFRNIRGREFSED